VIQAASDRFLWLASDVTAVSENGVLPPTPKTTSATLVADAKSVTDTFVADTKKKRYNYRPTVKLSTSPRVTAVSHAHPHSTR